MDIRTDRQQEVQAQLGGERLGDYIARNRTSGLSWDRIASDLAQITGEYISGETLRLWAAREVAA